jgi:hypothetical protein
MLGPGLLVGGSAIGGGEWLAGPAVTARYGGALMWLATLSILGQVFYNVEISRYALYTGEPIFTGKFRTLPGPRFWLFMYLLLDFGAVFPYLAANAATPLAAVYLGRIPTGPDEESLVRGLGIGVWSPCCPWSLAANLQHAQARHVIQNRDRAGLFAVRGHLLFQWRYLAGDFDRVRQIRHGAGPAWRRRQRQRRIGSGRGLGW